MVIKSPFKDYYDYFFYNDDKSDVFVRKTAYKVTNTRNNIANGWYFGYLDFFGKTFPLLYTKPYLCSPVKDYNFYWTADSVLECFDKIEIYFKQYLHTHFTKNMTPEYMLAFRLHQEDIICPKLTDTGLPSILPPVEARNLIVQYLAQAKPEKPIPAISDEVMAEIKGFDKFSFRKAKQCKPKK